MSAHYAWGKQSHQVPVTRLSLSSGPTDFLQDVRLDQIGQNHTVLRQYYLADEVSFSSIENMMAVRIRGASFGGWVVFVLAQLALGADWGQQPMFNQAGDSSFTETSCSGAVSIFHPLFSHQVLLR